MRKNLLAVMVLSCLTFCSISRSEEYEYDVVIYGGTSAAVTAAVQVKKMGKTVVIVSPDKHLGGMTSGGLGFTDSGNVGCIGGLAREFYHRVYLEYQKPETWRWEKMDEYGNQGQGTKAMLHDDQTMWIFEPHVAEKVFEDWLAEYRIPVLREESLDRENGVKKEGNRIVSLTVLSRKTFTGKMFLDVTYEGDLLAAAGVSYHVGREANQVYGEKWNGNQFGVFQHGHYFRKPVDPYRIPGDAAGGLLKYIEDSHEGVNGTGDHRVQAYCYRMCLTQNPENRVPFPKPENYNPEDYELLRRVFESGWRETFGKFDPVPNQKTDTNNHGPFSTDFIGMSYDYPEASYERRREILQAHHDYELGWFYYIANDPRVPEEVRRKMSQWGLAKDEFQDNGNWPYQIYVREARRMIGTYVNTEHECLGSRQCPRPVGMGSYSLDSHNVRRFVTKDGTVQNEGDIGVHPKKPYGIDYGAMIPKKEECTNLLVPVCVSSSHIAFGSIRMEPVFMLLGQSAATAAVMSIKN
ncbi:MAG: FAD-dependent oxidoreductase, partial [Planctomycetaceae bacterium]|nr:FAD-dependent oxidoreductase [Planctomycetaceae bacterium]